MPGCKRNLGGYTERSKNGIAIKSIRKDIHETCTQPGSQKIAKLFTTHFLKLAPKGVKVKVKSHHGGQGFSCPISSDVYKAASRAITEVYGIEPVPNREAAAYRCLQIFSRY